MGVLFHSTMFKYLKNLIIGVGASIVLLGALAKLQSYDWKIMGMDLIDVGLWIEAGMFLLLGLLPPEKDYYWEKLYPGLDNYNAKLSAAVLPTASAGPQVQMPALNGEKVEQQLGGMLAELQVMSRSMSSLKALQEADFSGVKDQISKVNHFYSSLNEAMANISDSLDDTKRYKEQLAALNKNLGSLNAVYGGMLNAMASIGK
jgi:hypothetical protein